MEDNSKFELDLDSNFEIDSNGDNDEFMRVAPAELPSNDTKEQESINKDIAELEIFAENKEEDKDSNKSSDNTS